MNVLVTVETVCERYGVERHTAGKILRSIPHFRIGNKLCAHEQELHEYEMGRMQYPSKGVKTSQPRLLQRRR